MDIGARFRLKGEGYLLVPGAIGEYTNSLNSLCGLAQASHYVRVR